MTTDITELAQSLKAAANTTADAIDRLKAFQSDKLIDLSQHEGEQLDIDIATLNQWYEISSPANIRALVEAMEKAQQEAEELSKFKEVMTSAAEALKAGEPLNLESLFKGELASAMFAMMFAGEFVRSGATNYLELLYDVPEFEEMTVTLQKVEGKTPGQRIAELESFRTAYMEWSDKTDWVNTDRRFGVVKPLGKHRADVLKAYIEHLESRTVTVKLPHQTDFDDPLSAYEAIEKCKDALTAAGITLLHTTNKEEIPMQEKINELSVVIANFLHEEDPEEFCEENSGNRAELLADKLAEFLVNNGHA